MASCSLPLISKVINRITSYDPALTADEKAVKSRRNNKIKRMKKELSKNLEGSSRVNQARAEQLFMFLETEEERLGMLKKGKYTRDDKKDLNKPRLPVAGVNLVHEVAINDEVDEMKLLKWELYQVSYWKEHGGVSPREVPMIFKEKGGDMGGSLVHGFSSKVYIDFGTDDKYPVVAINMQFQPIEEFSMQAAANLPKYANVVTHLPEYSKDSMPPRYSADEKRPSIELQGGDTLINQDKEADRLGPKCGFYGMPDKKGAPINPVLVRGLLGRQMSFEARPVKFYHGPFELSDLLKYEGKQTYV